jgi:serine/threonine protein kinase
VRPGTILGDQYEVLEQLGEGGMGVIYRARDTKLGRLVAIKTVSHHLRFDDEAKRRFMQEAQAASALDHQNICTIHDIVETAEGQVCVVMAFYEGHTLKHLLGERRFTVDECLDLGSQLASALERAHEAGIVHRDLKPSNIQVTERGETKLLDFGIAKLSSGDSITVTGTVMGSVGYASPEQLAATQVDHRTDLWALGVVLYEMLSGSHPFRRSTNMSTTAAVLHAEPERLDVVASDVPDAVVDVVELCLQKSPELRPPDAATVRRVLKKSQAPAFARSGGEILSGSAVTSVSPPKGFLIAGAVAIAILIIAMIVRG